VLHPDVLHVIGVAYQTELLQQAEMAERAAQLPRRRRRLRTGLAKTLHALGDWLEPTLYPAPVCSETSWPNV